MEPKAQTLLSVSVAAEVTGAWTTADPAVVSALDDLHVWTSGYLDKRSVSIPFSVQTPGLQSTWRIGDLELLHLLGFERTRLTPRAWRLRPPDVRPTGCGGGGSSPSLCWNCAAGGSRHLFSCTTIPSCGAASAGYRCRLERVQALRRCGRTASWR